MNNLKESMPKLIDDLTIVIVLYQENLELIRKSLKNIKSLKIIIIDNDNNSELKDKICKEFQIQKYILHKKNIGFAKSANIGIKLADTRYVMNMSADCLINQDSILKLLLANQKDPNCFITAPTFYYPNNNPSQNAGTFSYKKILSSDNFFDGDLCVDWVLGGQVFEKEMMEEIGMFDDNLFLYFPDEDIGRRALLKKKSIIQLSEATAIHVHGTPKTKNFFKRIYLKNFHYTHDELYYNFKINTHKEIFNKLNKKIPNYLIKILLNVIILRLGKATKYLSIVLAFNKFKKFLNNN